MLHDRHELDLEKLWKVDDDGEEDGRANVSHYPPPRPAGPHAVVVLDRMPNCAVPFQGENNLEKERGK